MQSTKVEDIQEGIIERSNGTIQGEKLFRINEEKQTYKIHRDVYTNPDIFEREMEVFFESGWLYLAHESEISEPGDYVTRNMGRQPVIVCRTDEGELNALINRCSHRGAAVCKQEKGNSSRFRCPYHAWSYENTGEVAAVPDRQGYGPDFKPDEMALETVPKLRNYKGFIFGSLNEDAGSLEEYLGNAKPYLDLILDRFPPPLELVSGKKSYGYDGNWKLQIENGLDYYHVPFVHESFLENIKRHGNEMYEVAAGGQMRQDDWHALYFGNGHSCALERHGTAHGRDKNNIDRFDQKVELLSSKWEVDESSARALAGIKQHFLLFPNLLFLENPAPSIRIIEPVEVDKTRVTGCLYLSEDLPDKTRVRFLRGAESFKGNSGMAGCDDVDMFHNSTKGFSASDQPWNDLSRGIHREFSDNDLTELIGPFEKGAQITDEVHWREMYTDWFAALTNGLTDGRSPKK